MLVTKTIISALSQALLQKTSIAYRQSCRLRVKEVLKIKFKH